MALRFVARLAEIMRRPVPQWLVAGAFALAVLAVVSVLPSQQVVQLMICHSYNPNSFSVELLMSV